MLKWFNKQSYITLGAALGAIQKELEALQPSDSSDIVWEKQANGITAKLRSNSKPTGIPVDESLPSNSSKPVSVAGEYSSFFKLVNASETSDDGTTVYKVKVMDGMNRGYNRCKVNNKVFNIQNVTLAITKGCLVVIRYTSSENKIEVMLTEDNRLPDDTAQYSWYQIGEIEIEDDMIIHQDHLSGVAQMFWYDICGD